MGFPLVFQQTTQWLGRGGRRQSSTKTENSKMNSVQSTSHSIHYVVVTEYDDNEIRCFAHKVNALLIMKMTRRS